MPLLENEPGADPELVGGTVDHLWVLQRELGNVAGERDLGAEDGWMSCFFLNIT